MGDKKVELKVELPYQHKKHTQVLEKTNFPICITKEKEVGYIRKKVWYVHRFHDRWDIIQILPKPVHYVFKIDD